MYALEEVGQIAKAQSLIAFLGSLLVHRLLCRLFGTRQDSVHGLRSYDSLHVRSYGEAGTDEGDEEERAARREGPSKAGETGIVELTEINVKSVVI